MKYRVYFIESFSEGTIKQTDDLTEATYAYYLTLFSGLYPRISVDGKQLRIEQAERLCSGIFAVFSLKDGCTRYGTRCGSITG